MTDVVNVGTLPDDGTGDSYYVAFTKINAALAKLLAHLSDGNNPHKVTAKQAEAATVGALKEAVAGLPTTQSVATAIAFAITALSLGTAATRNVGTAAGNVPVLDTGGTLLAGLIPASLALAGAPTAVTAPVGTSSNQLATTAFVATALAALVNASPAALDTLNELAAALGNDPNFATTVMNALAQKANTASLGSAATKNVGIAANNVVQLDTSARLPAVDASQLLNVPSTADPAVAARSIRAARLFNSRSFV